MKEQLLNSIEHILIFIAIIFATFLVAFLVARLSRRVIDNSTSFMKNDPTSYRFLRHTVSMLIYLTGFSIAIYTVPSLRALASSMLAGAGILAIAVGFASQHALSNVIGGVFIVLFKPFRINDRVKLRDMTGIIEDITLRHTVIRDFQNKRIIIPNSLISDEIIINSDIEDGKVCRWIDVRVSYEANINLAKKIIKEEIRKHPLHIDPRSFEEKEAGEPIAPVRVLNLGEWAITVRGWAWTRNDAEGFQMTCDLLESIRLRFDEVGIEPPYPRQIFTQNQHL